MSTVGTPTPPLRRLAGLRPHVRNAAHATRRWAGGHERAYRWLVSLTESRRRREQLVGPHTRLVVEGFGGSGNTFVVAALRLLGVDGSTIAHHHHTASQVLAGIRRGIPTVVLVRHPDDAVVSLLRRGFLPSAEAGLRNYEAFHAALGDRAGEFEVVTFEQLTEAPDTTVRRIAALAGLTQPADVDLADQHRVWQLGHPGDRVEPAPEVMSRADAMALVAAAPPELLDGARRARAGVLPAAGGER